MLRAGRYLWLGLLAGCLGGEITYDDAGLALVRVDAPDLSPLADQLVHTEHATSFALRNEGPLSAEGLRAELIQPEGGPFRLSAADCGASLASQGSCRYSLGYAPTTTGPHTAVVKVTYLDGFGSQSFEFPVEGSAGHVARLKIEEGYDADLGVLAPGHETSRTFWVLNEGNLAARSLAGKRSGDGEINFLGGRFPGTGGTCGDTLKAGERCALVAGLKPTTYRNHLNSLFVEYFNGQGVDRAGADFKAISADIAPELVFFGSSQISYPATLASLESEKSFRIVNSGYARARDIRVELPPDFHVGTKTCDLAELPVAQECEITLLFRPTQAGAQSHDFHVTYSDGASRRSITGTLSGIGRSPGRFDFLSYATSAPLTVADFGIVGVNTIPSLRVVLRNSGDVGIKDFAFGSAPSPFRIASHNCGTEIDAGATCLLTLEAQAVTAGAITASLRLDFHDGTRATHANLALAATAREIGVLSWDGIATNYTFTRTLVGAVRGHTLSLRNGGLADATNISWSFAPNSLRIKGGTWPGTGGNCPAAPFTLAAQSSCTVEVEFAPTARGATAATLTMNYYDGEKANSRRLDLMGTGQDDAHLIFSEGNLVERPNPTNFGAISRYPENMVLPIMIQNSGEVTATAVDLSLADGAKVAFLRSHELWTCGASVGGGSTGGCLAWISIDRSADGDFTEEVIVRYKMSNGVDAEARLALEFSVGPHGLLLSDPFVAPLNGITTFEVGNAPQGGATLTTLTFRNAGAGAISSLAFEGIEGFFAVVPGGTTCGANLAAGASCGLQVRFSPTGLTTQNDLFTIRYQDGAKEVVIPSQLRATGLRPAVLTITEAPLFDFGFVVRGNQSTKNLTVRNTGGWTATTMSLTALSAPYTLQTTCGASLAPNTTCSAQVTFAPTDIGVEHLATLQVNYNDGRSAITSERPLRGVGEPPLHQHRGWTEIFALGAEVTRGNVSASDRRVTLRWNAMIPEAESLTAYAVFRTTTKGVYDWSLPLDAAVDMNLRNFTDSSVSPGTVYYYTVRPIVLGYPSRSLDNFAEVRVVVPPDNMALVHRWMANQLFCARIGASAIRNQNFRCSYDGPGSVEGYYDFGRDLIVDRFELGADLSSRSRQLPAAGLSQVSAQAACTAMSGIALTGIASSAYAKRLLKRSEHYLASAWADNLSALDIQDRQGGATASDFCNGNGSSLEATGSNLSCVSRFGISDAAGNAWEWVSDRVNSGVGLSGSEHKLDPNNTDLDGRSLLDIGNRFLTTTECFSPFLGLPIPRVGASCPNGSLETSTTPLPLLANGYFLAPPTNGAAFPIVGGSFNSATTYPSIATTAFMVATFAGAGARCGFTVDP